MRCAFHDNIPVSNTHSMSGPGGNFCPEEVGIFHISLGEIPFMASSPDCLLLAALLLRADVLLCEQQSLCLR